MNKLGFGLMRLPRLDPNDPAKVDVKAVERMTDLLLSRGCRYFDTAWGYQGYQSERVVKQVLTDRYPREAFQTATKLHCYFVNDKADRDRIFFEQLKKTGLEYFDNYLLHDMNASYLQRYEELDCFAWLSEKKQQGLVRRIGFSCHDSAEVLEGILKAHPEMDFVQLQINWLDWESEGIQSRLCYETAVKFGKPVIVMEPVKGGTLANVPEQAERLMKALHPDRSIASWAIRFAASLPGVERVLSGMGSEEMVRDNLQSAEEADTFCEAEMEVLRQAADILRRSPAVACTGCAYCTEDCPANIPIPRYFSLYNKDLKEPEQTAMSSSFEYYDQLSQYFGKASACIRCGNCEERCPQKLPVRNLLKEVAAHFENRNREPEPDVM